VDEAVNRRRRALLQAGAALALGGLSDRPVYAALAAGDVTDAAPLRELAFMNLHTGESLSAIYWADGFYVPQGLAEINHILRDHRNDEVGAIAPRLLDLLYRLRAGFDTTLPFQVFSGYRSPASNDRLRVADPGVAKRSLHMEGMALDFCIEGIALADLQRVAQALHAGGVGYYTESHFVHVDIGRVRSW
jgi:uncharacterized protein YcbK (DUF882 family)